MVNETTQPNPTRRLTSRHLHLYIPGRRVAFLLYLSTLDTIIQLIRLAGPLHTFDPILPRATGQQLIQQSSLIYIYIDRHKQLLPVCSTIAHPAPVLSHPSRFQHHSSPVTVTLLLDFRHFTHA